MDYNEQLDQIEWKDKRNLILARDNFECKKCNVKRSDFLGLDYKFGILTYDEFLNQGYHVVGSLDKTSVQITKDGNKIDFINLIDEKVLFEYQNLCFAKKWTEGENKFVFASFKLVCFLEKTLDESKFFDLNIHHRYYIREKKAWEYDDEVFLTLCVDCHKLEHETNSITILDENKNIISHTMVCDRCKGKGVLPEYKYYKNGICFKCNGSGDVFESEI